MSRTPYLTALALWPKGDGWGGGGVFDEPKTIGLNHLTVDGLITPESKLEPWHPLGPEKPRIFPNDYEVRRWSEFAGRGEDNPICDHRMSRDGWVCVAEGDAGPHRRSDYAWLFNTPEIYERKSSKCGLVLRRYLKAIYQRNGPWYVEDFEVRSIDGHRLRLIENCSWADWQANGDLLFALGGCLYRLTGSQAAEPASDPLENAKLVADLAPLRIEEKAPPDWAREWV